jgi:hypothetical protein
MEFNYKQQYSASTERGSLTRSVCDRPGAIELAKSGLIFGWIEWKSRGPPLERSAVFGPQRVR